VTPDGDIAKICIANGVLRKWEPMIGFSSLRMVLLPKKVEERLLSDAYPASRGRIRIALDSFMEGDWKTIGFTKDCDCDLKRLQPPQNEIWNIRSLAPSPSVRVFGSFLEPDLFVVTNIAVRNDLKDEDSQECKDAIREAERVWNATFSSFGNVKPFSGENANDYVTENAALQIDK